MQILVLGSTGNLGQQCLELVEKHNLEISALTGHTNAELLAEQGEKFSCKTVLSSREDILPLIADADVVVNLLSGLSGIAPSLEALRQNKILLTANKESIIAEGLNGLIPIDSEHNAIYEILQHSDKSPSKLILPCSGGPLLKTPLADATLEKILAHPRWKMGPKVTVESALLINKGFEILEAHYLFGFPLEKIEVRIHPECQIHGMVEFTDGSNLAYIAEPDMREHIENALLRALGQELPPRNIAPAEFTPHDFPIHLPGIDLVLGAFKNGKIRDFLTLEESLMPEFLSEKLSLSGFLGRLTNLS